MKSKSVWFSVLTAGCLVAFTTGALAGVKMQSRKHGTTTTTSKTTAERTKKEPLTMTGTVSVIKSEKGTLTEIKLTSAEGDAYNLVMNAAARMLQNQDGKKVLATGELVEKGGVTKFEVKTVKAIAEPAGGEKPGAAAGPEQGEKPTGEKPQGQPPAQ